MCTISATGTTSGGAEGGTGYEHTISCGRSKNIWGPYENCPWPLLTNVPVGDTGVACAGHGDLVQAKDGSWWCVHLATRPDDAWFGHLGRETFLLPVTWKDEWPVIADGHSRIAMDAPLWAVQQPISPWAADLTHMEPQWLFLRQPREQNYIPGPEGMTLIPTAVKLSDSAGSPTLLLVRPLDICCTAEAEMDFTPLQDGDEAGVTMYISCTGYISLGIRRTKGRTLLQLTRSFGGPRPAPIEVDSGRITFRIQAEKDCCHLSFAGTDGSFRPVVTIPVLSRKEAGKCFTGTLWGVYAQCEETTAARALLRRFTMAP